MKIIFNEEKRLLLTYKYIEVFGERDLKTLKPTTDYIKISKIQTDFHRKSIPHKKLVKML